VILFSEIAFALINLSLPKSENHFRLNMHKKCSALVAEQP